MNARLSFTAAACLAVSTLAQVPTAHAQNAEAVTRDMLVRSNGFRASQGLPPLAPQEALSAAAQGFAQYMADTDRYGHEADGRVPADRTQAKGYAHCMVAENIAMQYRSNGFSGPELARGFMQGWIDSPGHRENLVSDVATDTGMGLAQSASSGRWYAVQLFGRPMASAVSFEVSNDSRTALRYSLDGKGYTLLPRVTRSHKTCTPAELSMSLPGADHVRLRPRNGARLRVEQGAQGLRMVQG